MTLVQRYENAERYHLGGDEQRLLMGGGISNTPPFDEPGPLAPEDYSWNRVDEIAPEVYRIRTGRFGYTVYRLTGEIRIHPVRFRWDLYYSVAPGVARTLSVNLIHSKLLELYVNTAQVRYSFFISDRGFKVNNRLKTTYTGGDEWSYTYNVGIEGLTRQGRYILHEGTIVGRLPDPFMVDADGTVLPVEETLNAGELTLTATGLNALTLPVDIDPSVTVQPPDADTYLNEGGQTFNYGSADTTRFVFLNNFLFNSLLKFDFSATAMDVITAATLEMYYYDNFGAPAGLTMSFDRNTRPDWVELEATWLIYKAGNNWTTPGGDRDNTYRASAVVPGAFGWVPWNILDLSQDALVNYGSVLDLLSFNTTGGVNHQAFFYLKEYLGNPLFRPKVSMDFLLSGGTPPHVFQGMSL